VKPAFTNSWLDRFGSAYDSTPLAAVPWFTAAPGLKVMHAVIDGLIPRGCDVVDLGCGPGIDAVFLAVAGARVTGIDAAPSALAKARALAEWAGVDIAFHQASIVETGLSDACADVVNDSFVFHNIADESRSAYAAEVHRILRPGGVFLLNAFSDRMVAGTGPRRISASEIFTSFLPNRFDCTHLEIYRDLPTAARSDQHHWFGVFRRVGEKGETSHV
jgi:ubiquinone/menaquinone biosynthesis C-methylase UbiE